MLKGLLLLLPMIDISVLRRVTQIKTSYVFLHTWFLLRMAKLQLLLHPTKNHNVFPWHLSKDISIQQVCLLDPPTSCRDERFLLTCREHTSSLRRGFVHHFWEHCSQAPSEPSGRAGRMPSP